jgi:hypothetical protein
VGALKGLTGGRVFASRASLIAVSVILFITVVVSITRHYSPNPDPVLPANEATRISECRTAALNRLQPKVVDLNLLGSVHGLCYAQVDEEDTLAEFGIRRAAFLKQQDETRVLMWMVVVITLSGVLLAGVQLVAAYKLASAGKTAFEQGGRLSLESNKISLTSSVTGVLILFISLFFFYIFVKEVYLIKEVGEAPSNSVAHTPDLMSGWSGRNPEPFSIRPSNGTVIDGPLTPLSGPVVFTKPPAQAPPPVGDANKTNTAITKTVPQPR